MPILRPYENGLKPRLFLIDSGKQVSNNHRHSPVFESEPMRVLARAVGLWDILGPLAGLAFVLILLGVATKCVLRWRSRRWALPLAAVCIISAIGLVKWHFVEQKRIDNLYIRQDTLSDIFAIGSLLKGLQIDRPEIAKMNGRAMVRELLVHPESGRLKLDEKGDPVDRWGTPLHFGFSGGYWGVCSAGADRKFGTGDDLGGPPPLPE